MLAALRGLRENGADVVAFAPVSVQGRRNVEQALAGIDVERRLLVLPFAHGVAHGVVAARRGPRPSAGSAASTCCTSRTGCSRRSAAGVRATTIHDLVPLRLPGMDARAHGAHARREVPARGADGARPRLQLGVHGARRARAAARRAGARARRTSRRGARLHARGRARRARAAVRADGRDARAAEEPRDAARRARAARRRARARRRRRRGLGAAAAPRPARRHPARLRRRRRARAPLPRRLASSSIRRASRASAFPCSRRWRAACPWRRRRTSLSTRRAATRPSAPIPTTRRRSPRAIREALARRDELVARGLAHASRFTTRAMGEALLAAYADAAARL